jgi:deoxyribodipyrimidine photo-lyase
VSVAVWWIRRDLRLCDNQALAAALAGAEQVVPVFVLDPALRRSPYAGERRMAFLWNGLRALDDDLRHRGSRLVVREGDPADALAALMEQTGAHKIFAEEDGSPYARRRDHRVSGLLPLHLTEGLVVRHPESVLKPDGLPYSVFTPYRRAWRARPLPRRRAVLPAPEVIATPDGLGSLPIPEADPLEAFPAGEREAARRLRAFMDGASPPVARYADTRDRMDLDGTSLLSPYLRFGMVSARQAIASAGLAIEQASSSEDKLGAETWLNELIWREFYVSILYHFPGARRESLRGDLRRIEWVNDERDFAAWRAGMTGYPVVDAAMRQLSATGWMPNRARMIVASFLTKDLLIDWRWGERHFMEQLVDGDPAANNGGWQWTAGTGTDAAPYFRIFNPVSQGTQFDPSGHYVRRWVHELARVPQRSLHRPWEMPDDTQRESGCRIGVDYPAAIVDHARARIRTLAAYRASREAA